MKLKLQGLTYESIIQFGIFRRRLSKTSSNVNETKDASKTFIQI